MIPPSGYYVHAPLYYPETVTLKKTAEPPKENSLPLPPFLRGQLDVLLLMAEIRLTTWDGAKTLQIIG